MIIIFLGAPGTGKGTIADGLKNNHNFIHISTGNIFKEEINSKSELGNKVKDIIESGILVNDETTFDVLISSFNNYDLNNQTILLDGYPRTINQAELLEEYIAKHKISFKGVFYFELEKSILMERLTGRLTCPKCGKSYHKLYLKPKVDNICDGDQTPLIQREDDKPKNIKVRLNTYDKLTKPLINFYDEKNSLYKLDCSKDIEHIVKDIIKVLK